jgi:PAS domain S-box-containing protein
MADAHRQLERAQTALETQRAVAGVLAEVETLAEATPKLLKAIGESLGWELGALWAVDRRAELLRCEQTWHESGTRAEEFERLCLESSFASGMGLPGRVWARAESQSIANVLEDENFARPHAAARAGLRAWFGFPIRYQGDVVVGVIEFFSRDERELDPALLAQMESFGNQIGQYIVRRYAEEAVLESEALKAAILESALDCVIAMDAEGRIVEFNPAAERAFGYRRDDVVGLEMAPLIIPPSLRDGHRQALGRYLKTGEARLLNQRLELTGMRADGTEFPVELTITRIAAEGPAMFTGYIRDITERRASEREHRLLSQTGELLGASLDYETILGNLARLVVPDAADCAVLDMVGPRGSLERLAVAHVDPDRERLARELFERYPPDPGASAGAPEVIRTGEPELNEQVSDAQLRAEARDEHHLAMLRELGVTSAMVVPLAARGRILGVLTFAAAGSARRFDRADLEFARQLASRASMAIDNARLYRERSRIAAALQNSLLPSRLPHIPGFEVAARFRAAGEGNEVGGDFYDLFETGAGEWAIVIGDVSGKGAEAAAVTAMARYTVRAAAMGERPPSEVLHLLNDAMLRERSPERFCSVGFGRLHLREEGARLRVASAGHPLPLVVHSDGTVALVGEPGTLAGVTEDPSLFDREVGLEPGDKLVFYTDGVTEARVHDGMLGTERLSALIASCAGLRAGATAERIEHTVLDGPGEPRDDIAVLVLEALATVDA